MQIMSLESNSSHISRFMFVYIESIFLLSVKLAGP